MCAPQSNKFGVQPLGRPPKRAEAYSFCRMLNGDGEVMTEDRVVDKTGVEKLKNAYSGFEIF